MSEPRSSGWRAAVGEWHSFEQLAGAVRTSEPSWRNINCYAKDTAASIGKHLDADEIEAYLKEFISGEHAKGVRGHCSDGSNSPGNQSKQTTDDLVIFHSWHRKNRPW